MVKEARCILTLLNPGSGLFGARLTYCALHKAYHTAARTVAESQTIPLRRVKFEAPTGPARCLACKQPTTRRLDREHGLHPACEDSADMARTTSA